MGGYVTNALTEEMFKEIIKLLNTGFKLKVGRGRFEKNPKTAFALILQANLGLRIGDVLDLKLNDIISDGGRYRLDIIETKTKKKRTFTVPNETYQYIVEYCLENGIRKNNKLINLTSRTIQRNLAKVIDHLGYSNISTHSFRKFFATSVYKNSNYNLLLVQELLQHSDPRITQKYIGISTKEIETALDEHKVLPKLI